MAGLDLLAGLGGGLSTLGAGMWDLDSQRKAKAERDKEREEQEALRKYMAELQVGEEMLRQEAATERERIQQTAQAERERERQAATQAAQLAEEARKFATTKANEMATKHTRDQAIAQLPADQQQAARAFHDAGIPFSQQPKPGDDLMPVDTVKNGRHVVQYVKKSDIKPGDVFEKYEKPDKPTIPVTPKDDPSLPTGVRAYIAGMPKKYADRAGAQTELQNALEDLYRDHPKLDSSKAFAMLDAIYGRRPTGQAAAGDFGDALAEAGGQEAPAPAPPAPRPANVAAAVLPRTLRPAAPQAPPRPPVAPMRSGGSAAPAPTPGGGATIPAPAAAPGGLKGGDVRTMGGKQVRITKVYPDGSFDAEPVK